jgi:hypothetical protein
MLDFYNSVIHDWVDLTVLLVVLALAALCIFFAIRAEKQVKRFQKGRGRMTPQELAETNQAMEKSIEGWLRARECAYALEREAKRDRGERYD